MTKTEKNQLSKAKNKANKAKATAKANAEAARAPSKAAPLALQNGGDRDGSAKGKGKGKGNGACYAWNDGKPCAKGAACPFKHICSTCGASDHKRPQCPQDA